MKTIDVEIKGMRPFMMHNVRLANPMEAIVQEIKGVSGKRKKTLEDHELLAQLEFKGGLYIDDEGPYIPGEMLHAAIIAAGKREKLGQKVKSGVVVPNENARLQYKGPKTAEGLWSEGFFDQRMVNVQGGRTLRTRPMFRDWSASFSVMYSPTDFNPKDIERLVVRAGQEVGIGDFRPRYGTFQASVS